MKQKTLTSLSVVAALGFLTPLPGFAFGLGQITLQSAMNEPFKAEITVNALRDDERGNLEVRLASVEDFERAGLDRSFLLTQLNFEVVEESDSTRILVTSDIPIKEPFLGFLLAATTGQGKLLREYTVLLDPPKELYRGRESSVSTPSSATLQTVPSVPRSTLSVQPSITDYKVRSQDTLWSIAERTKPSADITMQQMMLGLLKANPRAFQQNNVNSLYADSTLRIPITDEIIQISPNEAKTIIDQQNLAWQNRNRAFTPAPTLSANKATPPLANSIAASDSETEAITADDAGQSTVGAGEKSADTENARLKLITASENDLLETDPEINGDPDLQRISEQLTLAQETIEAQNQENIDFKNRMDALERQLDTMRRLISLKDADMARLQSLLEQDDAQMDLATLVDEANAILEGSEVENNAINTANQTDVDSEWQPTIIDNDETVSELASQKKATLETNEELSRGVVLTETTDADESTLDLAISELTDQEDTSATDEVIPQDKTASEAFIDTADGEQTNTNPEESNDDVAELESASAELDAAIDEAAQILDLDQQQMDSLYQRVQAFVIAHKVESLLAILLLLLIIWMVIRRGQREVSWDDAVSKIKKNKPVTPAAETGSMNIVTPVMNSVEIPPATESKAQSVDELVAQADMFVGYADYVQAGTALEQAHQQAPYDKEVAAKLMFIYYKQQKSADFIAILNTSGIDETHPQWPEIRSWGNQLLPHNPLFAEPVEITEEQDDITEEIAEQTETEFSAEEDTTSEVAMDSSTDPEIEKSDHIEFNLDDYKTETAYVSQADEIYQRDDEDMLQFDSIYDSAEKEAEIEPDSPVFAEDDDLRVNLDEDNVLQPDSSAPEILELSIEETEEANTATEEPEEIVSLDSLDSNELDLSAFETEDQTATETDDVIEDYLNLDSSIDDEELDFDLSDFDSIDEAETKLDLAAAYSDMGDPEGARGILEEVLEQGTDEQKKRAQELLDALS
ncbi:hypothetical protein Q7A_2198 [Methylophaga nitratireducenticrescens]|uniref:LysM domain-containing protein n=1 Tax=Methylophaga nitratireducenticrescens TaxID=754476 RepID=I1XKU3_METNJ|nr:FimV/HubP family polar landmark protein [Methylophaga nitratireducenticrescens]AFI85012.1 hypothetical protein Q7A_2198 [Methylophaga nitratireducenticrescens]